MSQPESWWIDPTYDPMQDLYDCKREITNLISALNQLISAHNQNTEMIAQLTQQNRQLLEMYAKSMAEINTLQRDIDQLQGSDKP
jgi:ABC-type transporter Mla subunit MlaD